MRQPDMRLHSKLAVARTELGSDGFLYDPAARRALAEMGRGLPTDALEAITAIRLAAKRIHDEFQAWTESHGLSESRFSVLIAIFHSPGRRLPLRALAERLNVVPRTITDVIDVLERDGLVLRVPDPDDRRSTHAKLTEAGLERITAIQRSAVAQQATLTKGLTADQLVQLRHLCLLLVQNLSDHPGGA
jgi:DNA-binding MarR family transcriptional regulator